MFGVQRQDDQTKAILTMMIPLQHYIDICPQWWIDNRNTWSKDSTRSAIMDIQWFLSFALVSSPTSSCNQISSKWHAAFPMYIVYIYRKIMFLPSSNNSWGWKTTVQY